MTKVVTIKFYLQDKYYDFKQGDFDLSRGDSVLVETELGQEVGEVIEANKEVDEKKIERSLKPVLRKFSEEDLEKMKRNNAKKGEAIEFCRKTIKKHDLPMKLVDAAYSFDGSKITFYFTSESRVDFRSLVKDLTQHFYKSVRIQQVGSRNVTKMHGGYGRCGRELCCRTHLRCFKSVTTEMAKIQQLVSGGSERITGPCGRLLCCLGYEAETYEKLGKDMPRMGEIVKSKLGIGKVVGKNVLQQTVDVILEKEGRVTLPVLEVKWKK